ncbi:MAG TPA: LysM peptidoglycan-binding domain-containing protein [Polyangiaceae bacterium]|nr:LysM peptidoglycan-binding domain-containing protein [Polyangiaceae bacterium]
MAFRRIALVLSLLLLPAVARAESDSPRTHIVYDGQRLGSIAKRYGVSVDALCNANEIRPTDTLKPGQRLLIPNRGDRDGTRARALLPREGTRRRSSTERPATHRVEAGQRLDSIARRYNISVDALRQANQLSAKSIIRPGQILRIPDPSGAESSDASDGRSYLRPSSRPGHIELVGYSERFRGQAVDRKGRVVPSAFEGACRVLAATGDRPRLDARLVRLLAEVSDNFGGRPLRIVSGYRTTSFFRDSRHKLSKAVDFSIPGVPNQVVRDYLRTLKNVGVGYYPNSSFVHLDVRDYSAYWVDYAGPGEAPRGKHNQPIDPEEHEHGDDGENASESGAGALSAHGALPSAESSIGATSLKAAIEAYSLKPEGARTRDAADDTNP